MLDRTNWCLPFFVYCTSNPVELATVRDFFYLGIIVTFALAYWL
jgi:hypothetical protein